MYVISIPGSAVSALRAAAAEHAGRSTRRGQLLKSLDSTEPVKRGVGVAHQIDVKTDRLPALVAWISDARTFASSESEKDALRRLARSVAVTA